MKWYDWGNISGQLVTFGRAIQGVAPYKVTIEADPMRCETGWCNYSKREIAVNPNLFPTLTPADQYRLTKAILVHEAGHRRFTTPSGLGPIIHLVFNILEDERIERRMSQYFAGLGHLLEFLAQEMLKGLPELSAQSDNPSEVLNFILRLRWAERAGLEIVPKLSAANRQKWVLVEPLVRGAWAAPTSLEVERTATEVARILEIKELPEWLIRLLAKLGSLEGKRVGDDQAEVVSQSEDSSGTTKEGKDEAFDGTPLPPEHPIIEGPQVVRPAPYLPLVKIVQPLVEELVELLRFTPRDPPPEPSPRGQRLSVREYIHSPATPFLVGQDAAKQPPTLAFRVLIDHSTSMNSGERMAGARLGALLLHLVGVRLNIPHEITLTPNDIRLANLNSGERGLALLAGIVGRASYEGIDTTLEVHATELLATNADIKLVLVIHDGYPDTPNQLKSLCQSLRGKVEVIGLGLNYDQTMAQAMNELFGSDRLILCRDPRELPKKLGTILQVIYR